MGLPYFPFYPDRWLSSSRIDLMTAEEERGYLRLLLRAWGMPDCTLPADNSKLLKWSLMTDAEALPKLMQSMFKRTEKGWVNPVLQAEWMKAKSKHEAMSKNASTRWKKESADAEAHATALPKQCRSNDNQNQNQNQNQNDTYIQNHLKKRLSPDSLRLSGMLADLILIHTPNHRELRNGTRATTIQRWADDIDRMMRLDGPDRTPDAIEKRIVFAARDSFWYKNILSGSTLRKQFDRLGMEMSKPGRHQHDKHAGIDEWLKETYQEDDPDGA